MRKLLSIMVPFMILIALTIPARSDAATAPITVWDKYSTKIQYQEGPWEFQYCSVGTQSGYPSYKLNIDHGYYTLEGELDHTISPSYDWRYGNQSILVRYTITVCRDKDNNVIGSGRDVHLQKPIEIVTKDQLVESNIIGAGYPDNGLHSDGFWYVKKTIMNNIPELTVSQTNSTIRADGTVVLTGTIRDLDNDDVTISAVLDGKTKQTTVTGTSVAKTWSLTWSGSELAEGQYTNIQVTASDGK